MITNDDYTLYVVINNDLHMQKGKIMSQIAHVIEIITERILKQIYEMPNSGSLKQNYMKYTNTGRKKIILKATQTELEKLIKNNPHTCEYVTDAGKTQIPAGSLTVVGFMPSNNNKYLFSNLKLL